jgi:hypothetical protein
VGSSWLGVLAAVMVFWNPRGILNKEVEFKGFLDGQDAVYAGIPESQTYKDSRALSDGRWKWDAGPEGAPSEHGVGPARGIGAFVDTMRTDASVVRSGKYTLWHRIEVADGGKPLAVGVGYFPRAQDVQGHLEANKELSADLAYFREKGYRIVFGGDMNAHTGANSDVTPTDTAGRMMLETVSWSDMVLVNTMPGKCTGGPSRVQVRKDGVQQSTIDYIMCSPDLAPCVESLVIHEEQMGSDHRPMVLSLRGLALKPPGRKPPREVWRIDAIPTFLEDCSWVKACQAKFGEWLDHTASFIRAVSAMGVEAAHLSDVLDWSFQRALDETAAAQLGTSWVGPKATPVLDAAARMAVQQRSICEDVMRWVMNAKGSSEQAKQEARTQFLAAGGEVRALASKRRQLAELRLFRDVEAKQGDSKLFWSRFREVRNSITVSKSPPPVATNAEGVTVTDPVEVVRAWRVFSAGIASSDLTGSREEGRYDDDYKAEVEARLAWLRRVRVYQPHLDYPITAREVFVAIRKLRMGSAPGEDGILTDILKTAADAVNNNKLRGNNTVVEALVLLFNFMFDNEVWPERWSSGVILPIHKHDSRLDPSNYRPITLLSIVGKLFGSVVNARLQAFMEATDSISDEQGGFRRTRGTPDQIFILRETLASRKERGLATYAMYVDARKAYDTVWREQAYVRIHDAGVRGKLWRQLQAMHAGLSRRVRHPLGVSAWFPVDRGVAQGAVESPLVYSCFIDGLAKELKAAGLGVWVAGLQIPLLMYADDIVLMAASQIELARMNSIVSEFARRNRFEFNGKKSGVMAFNATPSERARCSAQKWMLFDEQVEVVPEYTYLGTNIPSDGISWKAHVNEAIAKAKRRSADILWICRADRGMRPRTAITLWQSLVRPLLEYASELWSGNMTLAQVSEAEAVQMSFLRGTLGLHSNGSGVADEVVRAEVGCERLQDRWSKLKLGYWKRIFSAPVNRLLRVVAEFRRKERVQSSGKAYGSRGWMRTAEVTFKRVGMHAYWHTPEVAAAMPLDAWRSLVFEAVDATSDSAREARMAGLSSTRSYVQMKEWGANPAAYSFSSGEEDKLGQLVPERYLDDRNDLKGTRLKMLCRMGCMPVMDRVGREARPKWPKESRTCLVCNHSQREDIKHFLLECPAYAGPRARMVNDVKRVLGRAVGPSGPVDFHAMDATTRHLVLLGRRIGDPVAEDRIDRTVKRYLKKAWNARAAVTETINDMLGTSYGVFSALAA